MPELCQILYSEEYSTLMASLNHSLENKVYTEEALELTEQVLEVLASHYTTWHYRFQIVTALKRDLFEELDWCEYIALENEKNYQIWNYRQLIIEEILANPESASKFSYKREFPILNTMLESDVKNHHVWSYRKWLVERFKAHDNPQELEFTTELIDLDARNNSAWTHRFFLIFNRPTTTTADALAEIDFVKSKIALCPQNASSWNYLRGIFAEMKYDISDLESFCAEFADTRNSMVSSSFALEMLARIAISKQDFTSAADIYDLLSSTYDPMRSNYWGYLKNKLQCDGPKTHQN